MCTVSRIGNVNAHFQSFRGSLYYWLGGTKNIFTFRFKKKCFLFFLFELRTNDFVIKKYFHIIDPPTHFTGGQWWSHYINSLHVTWTWSILLQLLKRWKWQVTGRPRIMFYKNILVVLIGIIHENRADPFPSVLSREITLTKWHTLLQEFVLSLLSRRYRVLKKGYLPAISKVETPDLEDVCPFYKKNKALEALLHKFCLCRLLPNTLYLKLSSKMD